MIELKALQKQVALLEADLKPTGLASDRLKVEWRAAKSADRTAATFETWLGERVTQVAVAWVLATVFVRFCEDNGLIEYPFIAGPATASSSPPTSRASSTRTTRRATTSAGSRPPSTPCPSPRWRRACSTSATTRCGRSSRPRRSIKALLDFWRQTGEDGQIRYDLTDPEWNTRFLGDLYQDLSEAARKTYALLQTPEFVEEFILNYTLDPAIAEFGLEPAPPVRPRGPAARPARHRPGLRKRPLPARRVPPPAVSVGDGVAYD